MDDPILSKLIWAFGAVVVYGLLRWRLMRATHDFRVRTGVAACAFARDADATCTQGRVLAFLAARAYRPTTPWLLLLFLLGAVLRPNWGRSAADRAQAASAPQELLQLNVRLFWALISTSPLASVLALLVLAAALLWRSYVEAVRDGITAAMGLVQSRVGAAST